MSHATDGELHAFLDGALGSIDPVRADRLRTHLEGCPDCTARLDDARALHARAGEILADAEPGPVEVPPFEAILERRARLTGPSDAAGEESEGGSTPIPIRRARPPLARAASVAIALGAGWLGHAVWSGTRVDDMSVAPAADALAEGEGSRVSSDSRELAAAGSLEKPAVTEISDDVPDASGAAFDESEQARLENRAIGPTDAQEEPARIAASELPIPSGRVGELVTTGAVRGAGDRDDREPAPEPVERPAAANEARRDSRKIDQDARAGQDALAEREAGVAQDTPVSVRLQDAVVGAGEEEAARRQLADTPGEFLGGALARRARFLGGQLSWLTVSRRDAEHWIGGPVLEVPGLDPATLAISAIGEVRLVRAVQTLPGGETLELFHEPLATDEPIEMRDAFAAAPAARRGFEADYARGSGPVLVVERSGFRITGRAQVAADSLASLLSRLR